VAMAGQWSDNTIEPGTTYYYNKETYEYTLTKPIPSGWTLKVDPASDKTYYVSPSGQSQWNRPAGGIILRVTSKHIKPLKSTASTEWFTCPGTKKDKHLPLKDIRVPDVDWTFKPDSREQIKLSKKLYYPQGTILQCGTCNGKQTVGKLTTRSPKCGKRTKKKKRDNSRSYIYYCKGVVSVIQYPANTFFKCDKCSGHTIKKASLPPESHGNCPGKLEPGYPAGTTFQCDACSSRQSWKFAKAGPPPKCTTGCGTMRPVRVDSRRRLIERFIRESERCIAS